jgi:hypothetical protein
VKVREGGDGYRGVGSEVSATSQSATIPVSAAEGAAEQFQEGRGRGSGSCETNQPDRRQLRLLEWRGDQQE